jgi:hypothetical protein
MAITTEAGLIAARAGLRIAPYVKLAVVNAAAGQKMSMFRAAAVVPAQPAVPASTVVCDGATVGALAIPVTVGANSLYCDLMHMQLGAAGQMEVVDRIIQGLALNGTLTTAQATNTPAIPAPYTATETRWYLEWYTDTGATAVTATVAFTRADATTGTVAVALAATMRAGRKLEFSSSTTSPIASVQSVTLSATTGAAGAFGVVAEVPLPLRMGTASANFYGEFEGLIRIVPRSSPCISTNILCTTTSTGAVDGGFGLMAG